MAEKRKGKKKGQSDSEESTPPPGAEVKPNKLEYAIANYIKNKVPTKRTRFLNHPVSYFNSNKAIDILLDSSWATGTDAIFTNRSSVVDFGNRLLQLKFFHRAKKIVVTDKDLTPKELKRKKEKEKKKELKKEEEKIKEEKKKELIKEVKDSKQDKEKHNEKDSKKKKIRLDMHLDQIFVDGSEAYVWMYDPIPFWYYIAGALLLFAAVAVCLFPLWPPIVRQGVYYLSIAAAGFLGVILGLAVLRFIIFMIIWTLSLGRHHFWILPNLTEDVGFFESFWPLYFYEYKGQTYDDKKKVTNNTDEKKQQKSKNKELDVDQAIDSQSAMETDKPDTDGERQGSEGTESENSNSQAFEMVDQDDLQGEDKKNK